jgi:hypothetical protein
MQLGPKQCTYHDEAGSPMINSKRFPNLKSMTNYGHKLGLKVGWYFNNCYECHEKCPVNQSIMSHNPEPPRSWNPRIYLGEKQGTANERCYEGDVKALIDYGFDGVKLDACGWQMDLDLWQRLIQEHTKDRPVLIEACHWGRTVPEKPNYVIDESNATIDMGWCPFHYWRTSGDIWYVTESCLWTLKVMPHLNSCFHCTGRRMARLLQSFNIRFSLKASRDRDAGHTWIC